MNLPIYKIAIYCCIITKYLLGVNMFNTANTKCMILLVISCLLFPAAPIVSSENDIREFFESGVTYGFFGSDGLYCYPAYKEPRVEPPEDYIRPKVYEMYEQEDRKEIFDLSPGYIENHIEDRAGDTVMVIFAGNRVYGVIDTIVYYWPELEEGVVCVVRSLGAPVKCLSYPPNIMILRKDKFYNGIFIPYEELGFVDPSYSVLKDSLRNIMVESFLDHQIEFYDSLYAVTNNPRWSDYLNGYKQLKISGEDPFDGISARCFCVKTFVFPDTLFLSYICFPRHSSEYSWSSLLKIYKTGNVWSAETIFEPHIGPYRFEFNCAFDLDNDGVLEYYINNSIYQFRNGELILIHGGPFIGDI